MSINEDRMQQIGSNVFRLLLADRSAKRNIVWATDDYLSQGERFAPACEITEALLSGSAEPVIRPRVTKARAAQSTRTRRRAEVFTPSWVCELQNDLVDAQWYGTPGRTWQDYVCARRMEITCGEAPYLASRYDAVTGKMHPDVRQRTGLLDRKLRVVDENTTQPDEWFFWVKQAYQSIYGFEYQGDNLLLARESLLFTFMDHMQYKFARLPDEARLLQIADILSWNIWQMDGLTYTVPCSLAVPCIIRDWRNAREITFRELVQDASILPFDAVVGNPPYQEETAQHVSATNGQATRKSVFQYFQMTADAISSGTTSLIYPGARWIHRSGKGMAQFGLQQINDPALIRLDFYPDSRDIFSGVAIADGISIVLKSKESTAAGFTYVYHKNGKAQAVHAEPPSQELMPLDPNDHTIVRKVAAFVEQHRLQYLHSRILPRNLFGIESNFVANNPSLVRPEMPGETPDLKTELRLLTNDRAGKAGRARWFLADRNVIPASARRYIDEWQVVVSSANAGGQKRDNQIRIIDDHSAFGRSRVALGTFATEQEAVNFFHYANTSLIRFLFLMTDEALTSLGKMVPDLGDYTNDSPLVDFSGDLDAQLYTLFGLSAEETAQIEHTLASRRRQKP